MSQNTTPQSCRNRSSRSGTPQGTGYIPQFQDPQFQQQFPLGQQQIPFQQQQFPFQPVPFQLTYQGMIAHGQTPTNFGNPAPAGHIQFPPYQHQQSNEDETEVEEVPETQESNPTPESNPTQRQKGKGKKTYETRAKKQQWTRVEEEALMSAYIDVSEDPIVGNAQSGVGFWKRVECVFYRIMGRHDYSTYRQLNTKLNDLKKKVTRFSGIYNNAYNNSSSGMSDADVLSLAYTRYQDEVGMPFGHEDCWNKVKHNPKWSVVPTMSTHTSRASKRSKTSESSDANFNLGDDDDDEDEIQEPQRPIGRNKAKRGSSSNTPASNVDENFTRLVTTITELKDKVIENVEYKMKKFELEFEKRFEKDFNFYISDHRQLEGDVLKATLARNEKLRIKYGW